MSYANQLRYDEIKKRRVIGKLGIVVAWYQMNKLLRHILPISILFVGRNFCWRRRAPPDLVPDRPIGDSLARNFHIVRVLPRKQFRGRSQVRLALGEAAAAPHALEHPLDVLLADRLVLSCCRSRRSLPPRLVDDARAVLIKKVAPEQRHQSAQLNFVEIDKVIIVAARSWIGRRFVRERSGWRRRCVGIAQRRHRQKDTEIVVRGAGGCGRRRRRRFSAAVDVVVFGGECCVEEPLQLFGERCQHQQVVHQPAVVVPRDAAIEFVLLIENRADDVDDEHFRVVVGRQLAEQRQGIGRVERRGYD